MTHDSSDTPHPVPFRERPFWEPPTLTYQGRLREIVLGGGKQSGGATDPGVDATRKLPQQPPQF